VKLNSSDENRPLSAISGQAYERPPTRLIARYVAEIQLATLVALLDALEASRPGSSSLDRAVILMVIMRASLQGDRTASDGELLPDDEAPDAAISVNAIAASLGRPFETVRRHANALVADGLCKRTKRGITLQIRSQCRPEMCAAIRKIHDLMVRLIDYAVAHEVPMPPIRASTCYNRHATVVAGLDLMLAAAEYLHAYYADWLEMFAVNAVLVANARPVTFNPVLARQYANNETIPPESLRTPVAVADIARALRVPYSTLQREINRSIERGQLRRTHGGILITDAQIAAAAVNAAGPIASARAMRAFGRLSQGGFPFNDPASCYLVGPPPLLDFGLGQPDCPTDRMVTRAAPAAGS